MGGGGWGLPHRLAAGQGWGARDVWGRVKARRGRGKQAARRETRVGRIGQTWVAGERGGRAGSQRARASRDGTRRCLGGRAPARGWPVPGGRCARGCPRHSGAGLRSVAGGLSRGAGARRACGWLRVRGTAWGGRHRTVRCGISGHRDGLTRNGRHRTGRNGPGRNGRHRPVRNRQQGNRPSGTGRHRSTRHRPGRSGTVGCGCGRPGRIGGGRRGGRRIAVGPAWIRRNRADAGPMGADLPGVRADVGGVQGLGAGDAAPGHVVERMSGRQRGRFVLGTLRHRSAWRRSWHSSVRRRS